MGKLKTTVGALRPEAMDEEPMPAEEPAEDPPAPGVIEYDQPEKSMLANSPYEHPIATVHIGRKSYGIPVYYLEIVPQLKRLLINSSKPDVELYDVDEDIGHTLIHFLYTGQYETLDSGYDLAREYRRSALAYATATRYGLLKLETVARKYLEYFGALVNLQDVLETAKEIFLRLPTDDTWFQHYLKEYFASSFTEDRFDRTIMQLIVEILFGRIVELEKIVESVVEPAPASKTESQPEFELNPLPSSEPMVEPEALPDAIPEPLSESENGLGLEPEAEPEPEPKPDYGSGRRVKLGDPFRMPLAKDFVNASFSDEDIPVPEPEIPEAPEDPAEAPRLDHPPETSPVAAPVESDELEELEFILPTSKKKEKKKKKKRAGIAVAEVDQPALDPVDWP